jgi:hypothetical protein
MTIQSPTIFRAAFDELQNKHDHTIRMIPADKKWLDTFNCYAFALGIVDCPRYQELVETYRNGALANSGFMSALLMRGELAEIDLPKVRVGNLVLYMADGRMRHGGIVMAGRHTIRSKWGPSELYEHGLWEVPESYGAQVQFAGAPGRDRIIYLLERYIVQQQ